MSSAASDVPKRQGTHNHNQSFPRRAGDNATLSWGHTPGDMARVEANYKKILAALS